MNQQMTREQILATIVPKSDQINYDDLIGGPMTVTVDGVSAGSPEQPVNVRLRNEKKFYRPCKTMRRLLILLWGDDGHAWIGRSMTLYGDPNVKFGGVAVGGIRISHMTDINGQQEIYLTVTKGKKAPHKVLPLAARTQPPGASPPLTPASPEDDGAAPGAAPPGGINADYIITAAEHAADIGYVELEKYGFALSDEGKDVVRKEWKRLKARAEMADLRSAG